MNAGRFATGIVLAAGRGERFGGAKQFSELAGEPMLHYSLGVFESSRQIDEIIVVLPEGRHTEDEYSVGKVAAVAPGGRTRQDSLSEGLEALSARSNVVVVHDAARPLLSPALLTRVIEGLGDNDGVIPVLAVSDALKEVSEARVASRPRQGLFRAQTPQAFRREALEQSLEKAKAEGKIADDCSQLLEWAGMRVATVEGDNSNLKVTSREDLELCEAVVATRGLKE